MVYWFSAQYLWKPASPVQNTVGKTHTEPMDRVSDIQMTSSDRNQILLQDSDKDREDDIILSNSKMKISFSNVGAVINKVILNDFELSAHQQVNLIPDHRSILQITDLLPDINERVFDYTKSFENNRQTITFEIISNEHDIVFRKRFVMHDDYLIEMFLEGENLPNFDSYTLSMNSGISVTETNKAAIKDMKNSFKIVSQINWELRSIPLSKLSKGAAPFTGSVNWAAVRSKYFTMAIIPDEPVMATSLNPNLIGETMGFDLKIKYSHPLTNLNDQYKIYLGPVVYHNLKKYDNGMENIAEFGAKWLRWLAKLFLIFIQFLHKYIGNYGVVIIIFALILKFLLSPLTNKALNAGKQMQKIQPYVKEIQTKYKDIKKQQEELRKLYKEHKVNPLGGCLPLLLQMPIFFALYPVLRYSIEFRQASFFGWLSDLSEPDPYWVLPIAMGIFMFVQQKMTQTAQDTSQMDEKQLAMVQSQKMMLYMMPPFMVFIFSSLPAGLVLYWTTFNVFSIIQQYFLNKKNKKEGKI